MMKKISLFVAVYLVLISTVLQGCQAIGDIFKAGVWSGIIIVVLIIVAILYLVNRSRK